VAVPSRSPEEQTELRRKIYRAELAREQLETQVLPVFGVGSEREECLCEPAYSTHIFSFLFSFFPGRLILSFLLA